MKSLSYIIDTGIKKTVGSAACKDDWERKLVYLDNSAYENVMMPAYTDVVGSYPQRADETMDTFYLEANYTLLKSEQNRIDTANIILGGLSLVILVIGVMNYGNMLSAALSVRRREIAVMQSLGLTKNQLWKMIFYEGSGYWGIVISATLTAGSLAIWILGKAIKNQLLYFKFIYPWQTLFILSAVLLGICFIFSSVIYLKNRSFTDELRRTSDE